MTLLLGFLGCAVDPAAFVAAPSAAGPTTPPPRRARLHVEPVGVPEGAARREVRAATTGLLDEEPFPIRFQTLARTGDRVGEAVFGQRHDRRGASLGTCDGLDYTGLWKASTGLTMVTHFECQPGAIYLTAVDALADGRLLATATKAVDGRPIDGGNFFCAGAPTSWDSHLAAEEYEGDARKLLPDGNLSDDFEGYGELARWWGGRLVEAHPWRYGWIVEVTAAGAAERRWALGRFSHEIALPMPDERTVYLSDDTADGGALFLFQADRPRDLSSGTLWAARWQPGRGVHDYGLAWVSLGHATDDAVERVVAERPRFDDLFDVAAPVDGVCPDGLRLARTNWGAECLRPRPGREAAASRLEARRAAALAGATTELVKTEGLAYAPELRSVFLAMTRFEGPALAGAPADVGRDDLTLPPNRCGGVWRLALGEGPAGGPTGPFVATAATLAIAGVERDGGCDADGIANPDNLAWIDGAGVLAIGEDTGHHANNALWFYDVAARALTRVLTAPLGAEVSGLRWTPGVGPWSYLSVSIQHPFEGDAAATVAERRSIAGVLGPFPAWE